MFVLKTALLAACAATIYAQSYNNGPTTTPVPILKQINKQNDDGSYSYGYEAADGSFKIETKYPNGDVAGKYGYVDETGKTREISYGASSQRGFEPQGTGIMVPPPTVYDPTSSNALTDGQEDDGQYREDPKIYEDPKYNSRAQGRQPSSAFRQPASFAQFPAPTPETQYQKETIQPALQPQYQQTFQSAPQPQYQQNIQPAQYQPTQTSQFRSGPLYTQQTSLFNQAPQQFPQQNQFQNQQYRPQSQVYHQQPQFSYQAYTPQPQYSGQAFPSQTAASQNYQSNQDYNPFAGHPAQNFNPNTGSYSINFTG